jgi:hypothetical protein
MQLQLFSETWFNKLKALTVFNRSETLFNKLMAASACNSELQLQLFSETWFNKLRALTMFNTRISKTSFNFNSSNSEMQLKSFSVTRFNKFTAASTLNSRNSAMQLKRFSVMLFKAFNSRRSKMQLKNIHGGGQKHTGAVLDLIFGNVVKGGVVQNILGGGRVQPSQVGLHLGNVVQQA